MILSLRYSQSLNLNMERLFYFVIITISLFNVLSICTFSAETNGKVSKLSYRVSKAVCASAAKFVTSNRIDSWPQFYPVHDLPCKTLTWNKCGSSVGALCKKFKLNDCLQSAAPTTSTNKKEKHPKIQPKIVNGTDAKLHEFPYMVYIKRKSKFRCGGTILNQNYIITAAHCLTTETDPAAYEIVAGDQSMQDNDGTEQFRRVKKLTPHEFWDSTFKQNDIGLIQLEQPLEFSELVFPPNFPDPNHDATGQMGTATGWGRLFTNGPLPTTLQKVTVPIITTEKCADDYSKISNYKFPNVSTVICAAYPQGGKDTCQGDSGGPITAMSQDGCSVFVGITSFSRGCADPRYPGVYTRVASFIHWINDHAI